VLIFPHTVRQRLVAVCATGALAIGLVTTQLAQADTHRLKHEQSHAQHQVKQAQADLDESSGATNRAYAALTTARAELHKARRDLHVARAHVQKARKRDHRMQAALVRAKARLATAQENLVEGKQAVVDQHTQLVDTVNSLYEEGDPQLIGFLSLLNAKTPADLTRKNEANNVVLGSQDQALEGLQAATVMLQVRESQNEDAQAKVEKRRAAAAANLAVKREYKQKAVDAKARIVQTVLDRAHALKQAKKARAKDKAKLARSKRQAARIHRQLMAEIEREKRAAQRKGGSANGFTGATNGYLNLPVNGPITSPYGWRIHPIYHYWGLHDGDDFGAPCGAPLFAVANGTVLSEYYSDVWGNRLYINLGLVNGKNVTVIYNHLSAYRSTVGQHVSRGQVVGLVGTTGWSTGCHTHFTVMVNGTAVDPAPWFGN
jgi:murein DD-endopeptidase MepM/ murein hydrolase activator NlpD